MPGSYKLACMARRKTPCPRCGYPEALLERGSRTKEQMTVLPSGDFLITRLIDEPGKPSLGTLHAELVVWSAKDPYTLRLRITGNISLIIDPGASEPEADKQLLAT